MSHDTSDAVEALLVRCLERPEEDWPAALDAAAREHPEHADELRARVRLLADVDSFATDEGGRDFVPDDFEGFSELRPIGRGGMGLVYRAWQASLRREVAIKVIRPERLLHEGSVERFRREVETVAQLRAPGIVSIHTVGETVQGATHLPWFAMELLTGTTLASAVKSLASNAPEVLTGRDLFDVAGGDPQGPVDDTFEGSWVRTCLRVALQVARALEHAHGRGVLHRDVKPGNVMIEPTGRVVLFDFGLTATRSAPSDRLTESGHPVGTLVYMAPEQLRGAALDERADVYSLGVTLYELLALQAPFEGESALDVGRAIEEGAPSPLRARNRGVSPDVQTVCLTAMARRPGDRYGSAAAFAADLENVLTGRPIQANPPRTWTRVSRWVSRKPAASAAIGLAVVLLVGAPLALYLLEREHARELGRTAAAESRAKTEVQEANQELEDVLAFTLDLFTQAAPDRHGGDVPDAVEMLRAGSARLADLEASANSKGRLDLAFGQLFSTMTELEAAEPHLIAAIAHLEGRDEDVDRARLAEALRLGAHNAGFRGEYELARERLDRSLALSRELYASEPTRQQAFLATAADLEVATGRYEEALEYRREALAIVERATGSSAKLERDRVIARGLLGATLRGAGRHEEARPWLSAAVAAMEDDEQHAGSFYEQFALELSALERLEGRFEQALELASEVFERLKAREGEGSLMTAQASYARAQALGRLGRHDEALAGYEYALERMRARLTEGHRLVLRIESYRVGTLTTLGRNREVLEVCERYGLVEAFLHAFGVASEEHRALCRNHAMSAQVLGEHGVADASFVSLEAGEREAAEWSGDHAGAVLLLAAHRGRFTPEVRREETMALLRALIAAAGPEELPVDSLADGQTYEAGYMARLFLAPLLEMDGAMRAEGAALRIEAEERRRRIQRQR